MMLVSLLGQLIDVHDSYGQLESVISSIYVYMVRNINISS